MKEKAIFIVFKGLSIVRNPLRPKSVLLNRMFHLSKKSIILNRTFYFLKESIIIKQKVFLFR